MPAGPRAFRGSLNNDRSIALHRLTARGATEAPLRKGGADFWFGDEGNTNWVCFKTFEPLFKTDQLALKACETTMDIFFYGEKF